VQIGRILLDMLGVDGQLDPSIATLAVKAAVHPSTVTRALSRLNECGFLDWTRRLLRAARTGWRTEQTSNAYVLRVPACDPQFAPAANILKKKNNAWGICSNRSARKEALDRFELGIAMARIGGDYPAKPMESWTNGRSVRGYSYCLV
jgi:hypothetical protein